jgi:hypothetical protein
MCKLKQNSEQLNIFEHLKCYVRYMNYVTYIKKSFTFTKKFHNIYLMYFIIVYTDFSEIFYLSINFYFILKFFLR